VPLGSPAEIAYWLGTLRKPPSVDEIQYRWEVGRSTAFRWAAFARSGGRSQQAGRKWVPRKRP
jgi:carboxylesterase type B